MRYEKVSEDVVRRRQRWLAALRSGRYLQANGILRRENVFGTDEYCCLGVACKVTRIDPTKHYQESPEVIAEEVEHTFDGEGKGTPGAWDAGYPPHVFGERFGVYTGHYSDAGFLSACAALNDTFDYSFEQIADEIERLFGPGLDRYVTEEMSAKCLARVRERSGGRASVLG